MTSLSRCTEGKCFYAQYLQDKLERGDFLNLTPNKQEKLFHQNLANCKVTELLERKVHLAFFCHFCGNHFVAEGLKFLDIFQAFPLCEGLKSEKLQVSEDICFHIKRTLYLYRQDPYLEDYDSLGFESEIVRRLILQLYNFFHQRFVQSTEFVNCKIWIFTFACKECSSFVQHVIAID